MTHIHPDHRFPRIAAPPAVAGTLAALAAAMLLSSLGTSVANVALPTFAGAFGASFQAVQWIVLAYLLAVTALVVSVGRLGDLVGRRRLLLGGIGVFTAASVACGASSALWMLIVARAVQGGGAAVMMALSMALVADVTPDGRAGRAMGLLGTVSAAGTALGPSLGGLLIEYLGWPSIFLVNVPLGLAAFVLAQHYLPRDTSRQQRPTFDLTGTALLVLTLLAYALAMTRARDAMGPTSAALLVMALAGAGLFLRVESRVPSPLVRPRLFRDRIVGTGFVTSALVTTVAMTTLVVGPFYLSGALSLPPAAVGALMTAGPLAAALAGVPAGHAIDRFGARRVMLAGLVAVAAGCLALAVLPVAAGISGYVVPLVLTTAGFASFQAANNAAVMAATEPGQRGVIAGFLNLSRNLGLITGASAMGAVFAFAAGGTDVTDAPRAAIAAGTHAAFGVAALLAGAALVLAAASARSMPRRG